MPLTNNAKEYTYSDYMKWPENERWEIIDGVAYMQAAPTWQHQSISGELYRQFSNYLIGKQCSVFSAPFDLCLKEAEQDEDDINKVVQPDLVVICDENKLRKTGYFGVPLLVIEISSPATSRRDRVYKFNMYEKAGVKEYWIVDPDGKFVDVFSLQENGRYGRPEIFTDENKITVNVFEDLEIDLSKVFANI